MKKTPDKHFCSHPLLVALLAGLGFLLSASTFASIASADIGEQVWQKTFNTSYTSYYFGAFETVNFLDNNTLLAGGHGDGALAVRYDAATGTILDSPPPEWIRYDTGSDYFYGQVIDANGDIYFAGRKHLFDPAIWKYDSSAALQPGWPKVHTGAGDGLNEGIALDSSGFIYAVGYNNSDWIISKFDKTNGTSAPGFPILFDFGGNDDKASKIAIDSEDNFIVSGWVGMAGGTYDWHVRKYTSDGTLLWSTSYDLNGNTEAAIDVSVDSEDNIIVCGYRNNGTDEGAGMARDWYIVKYAKNGDGASGATVLWEQFWNSGNGAKSRVARALLIDSKDNVYVAGDENDSSGAARPFIQYRDGQTGELLKSQELNHPVTIRGAAGTAGTEHDFISDLALHNDQLVVAGYVWEGYLNYGRTGFITLIKLIPEVGNETWTTIFNEDESPYNALYLDIGFLSDGNVIATGDYPWDEGFAVRYDADTGAIIDSPAEWISMTTNAGQLQFRRQTIDANGNVYFAGHDGSHMRMWKYTAAGAPSWEAISYTGSVVNNYNIAIDSLANTYSVGAIGNYYSPATWNGVLTKINADGSPAGAPFPIVFDYEGGADAFAGITVDSHNNIIVSGFVTDSATNTKDAIIQKYSSTGTLLWQKEFDGIGLYDHYQQVRVDSNDNIIVLGHTNQGTDDSSGTFWHWLIVKYAPDGTVLWQQTWNDGTSSRGSDLVIDEQDNFYLLGQKANSMGMNRMLIQYREGQTGNLLKLQSLSHLQTHFNHPDTENDNGTGIALKEGKLAVSGYIRDTTNPSTYSNSGLLILLDRTFVVTPSSGANGTVSPAYPVEEILYNTTTDFILTPEAHYHPITPTGTCPAGTLADNGNGTWTYTTGAITADCTVIANFAIDTFTLTYTAGANGTITGTSPQTVVYDASGSAVTAAGNTGYHFVDWSDGSTDNPRTDAHVAADITVTANFAIDTFMLTYTAGANGSVTGTTPQVIDFGADGTAVTAVPEAHYHFTGWSDGATDNPRTDTNVTADISVTANFAIDTFTLTYTAGANGSVTGTSPQVVDFGADGTAVTAVPANGYHFSGWDDHNTANPRTDTNISEDISVLAVFEINTYTVNASVTGGNGSISPAGDEQVPHGTTRQYTLTPAIGYHVEEITGTCGGTLVGNIFTTNVVTADCTVIGSFSNQYTLSLVFAGNGSGTVTFTPKIIDPTVSTIASSEACTDDCSINYLDNATVILSATADAKNLFTGWSGDGCSGTDDCQITMDQAREITATFKKDFSWPMFLPAITGISH